eukprot:3725475-Rhodomonas_salina.1
MPGTERRYAATRVRSTASDGERRAEQEKVDSTHQLCVVWYWQRLCCYAYSVRCPALLLPGDAVERGQEERRREGGEGEGRRGGARCARGREGGRDRGRDRGRETEGGRGREGEERGEWGRGRGRGRGGKWGGRECGVRGCSVLPEGRRRR